MRDLKVGKRLQRVRGKDEGRFLSAQADAFAGANAEEKESACSVRNDATGLRNRV